MTDVATDQPKPKQYRGFAVIKDKNPELQREISSRGGVACAEQRWGDQPGMVVAEKVLRMILEPRVSTAAYDLDPPAGPERIPVPAPRPKVGVSARPHNRLDPREPTQAGRVIFRTVERPWRWWHMWPFTPTEDTFRIDITASGSVGIRHAAPGEHEGHSA